MAQFRRTERTETTLSVVAVQVPWSLTQLCLRSLALNQSINQSINLYRATVQRRVLQCGYDESKTNVLRRILNVLADEAVRQFSGRESLSDRLSLSYVGLC